MSKIKTFKPMSVSSKFAICGVPLRVDTYKTCSFGCKYCFSNCRKIMEFEKTLQVGNLKWLENKLNNVYVKQKIDTKSFIDVLLNEKITWHCGGMSDPFQPAEKKFKITSGLIDIANKYDNTILFSTKSDTVYDANINPKLHSFQLSVTNVEDRKDIEPNVPSISSRYKFYKDLKKDGFKVGIRVQPFIPNVTTIDIVDMFNDADYFTIEGLKLVPQNKEHKDYLVKLLGLDLKDFTQMGLLNLKSEIRKEMYKVFIDRLNTYKIPYSLADNDMHDISSSKCCCGEPLIFKSTNFNNTAMIHKYGKDYKIEDVKCELGDCGGCKANHLFTSNRQEGCVTVEEFYDKRFDRNSSPFSPKFIHK